MTTNQKSEPVNKIESHYDKRMAYLREKFGMSQFDLREGPTDRIQTLQDLVDKQAKEAELGFIKCFANVFYKGKQLPVGFSFKL